VTTGAFDPLRSRFIAGTADGTVVVADVTFTSPVAELNQERVVLAEIATPWTLPLGQPGDRVQAADFFFHDGEGLVAAIMAPAAGGPARLIAGLCASAGGLMAAAAAPSIDRTIDLTEALPGAPVHLLVNSYGEGLLVSTSTGDLAWCLPDAAKGLVVRQVFRPFGDRAEHTIGAIGYVFGDVSVVCTAPDGEQRIFSLFMQGEDRQRRWGQTKTLDALSGAPTVHAGSVRNKAYLQAVGDTLSLRYATTAAVRWTSTVDAPIVSAVINAKYERIAAATTDGRILQFDLDDPHPESSLRGLFGKVWYEGQSEAAYKWSSSGANDDFEPKLSMIPLIFGTLKATFYAMLIAVPLALLGAVYTSEFMAPRFKTVVKPAVEIMASLPSVVLGFLAALWLAPLLESRVPSVLCIFVALPLTAIFVGWGWSKLNPAARSRIRPGYEFIALVPVMLLAAWSAWSIGPVIESLLFTVQVLDPTGQPLRDAAGQAVVIGDFRRWWPAVTGLSYENRNALIVGFIMGFAVIPIIFTITEDALSNVPKAMRSGSLACGASRWQTAMRVVVPTASAGIFSAVMIGLGRAIGETMIVVMATGNTAIMDINIFNGMRTLAANIAVELPEAPQHSTLYRALFLGAFLLFLFTFVVNTAAELLRAHLREKYKTV
jgi:phosphate transport system permease protein